RRAVPAAEAPPDVLAGAPVGLIEVFDRDHAALAAVPGAPEAPGLGLATRGVPAGVVRRHGPAGLPVHRLQGRALVRRQAPLPDDQLAPADEGARLQRPDPGGAVPVLDRRTVLDVG